MTHYTEEGIDSELSRMLPHTIQQAPYWKSQLSVVPLTLLVIYGALIFIRRERALMRLNRGLCPGCAYPIGESDICTECGYHLPAHQRFSGAGQKAIEARRSNGSSRSKPG